MTTEINNLITQGLTSRPGLSQSPVPKARSEVSETPETPETTAVESDNIVRVDFESRQNIATENTQVNAEVPQNNEGSLTQTLNQVNLAAQNISRKLEFRIDENSGRTVITVRDSDTQEVIRQIPSEQLLDVAARIEEIKQDRSTDSSVEALGVLFTSRT